MDTDRRADPLDRGLRDLKERGCSLLVVNDAGSVDVACRRLGGSDRYARRRCYVPITTTVASVLDRHAPSPRNGAFLGVVDATTDGTVRGTATPIQPGQVDEGAEWYARHRDRRDLSGLARRIETHLDQFADRGDPLEPGEVRLCVESLDPLVDDPGVDRDDVRAFLESVATLLGRHRAIGHFHVAAATADEVRAAYEASFDATVRVRTTDDGTVQQRWRLHDEPIETDWLVLGRR